MNYRLKKDLPFAKAGTIIELSPSEGCIPMAIYDFRDLPGSEASNVNISKEYLDELISEGWIEPIKPREFYVTLYGGTNVGTIHNTEDEAQRFLTKNLGTVIKVREVTE